MYITVKLLNGYDKPLTYKIPNAWPYQNLKGKIVTVPIRNKTEHALVCEVMQDCVATFTIREVLQIEQLPSDVLFNTFVEHMSYYYAIDSLILYKRMRTSIAEAAAEEADFLVDVANSCAHPERVEGCSASRCRDDCIANSLACFDGAQHERGRVRLAQTITLTAEQQHVVDGIRSHIMRPSFQPTLLHGVTGSGKTEVYKELIKCAYAEGKTALLLLPEVSLAVNFANLLSKQLEGAIPIYSFHSATPAAEKRAVWQQLLLGKPLLLIGVHMPLLLPIANLGCIIIDEEHEVGFQEKKHPRINTKEAALMRAKLYQIPIVLGSATPSMSSLYNVAERGWNYFQLKQRFAGKFPEVSLVKLLRQEKRNEFWVSKQLELAIADRIARNEQVIIFLNRRGYSFFVQCSQCSFIISCPNCSVSLTYHEQNRLVCHYCDVAELLPSTCSSCNASEKDFIKKGIGTQQVVTILQRLFPQARIGRADADSTKNKKKWQQTMRDFHAQNLDILVGTQTITKGYHFPKVTLVGILWAELNLNIPIYNAAETTLQQLIQVAGRAGRASETSAVIVQTFSEHQVFSYLNEDRYQEFYAYEMEYRKELRYPPYIRFAEIELRGDDEAMVGVEAKYCAQLLQQYAQQRNWKVTILGPARPPVYKIKNVHLCRLYVKSADIKQCIALFHHLKMQKFQSLLFFTPNPV